MATLKNQKSDGKPNLASVTSVLDPLLSDNFRLEFDKVPGATGNTVLDSLIIQCQRASKPGSQIEVVPVELFGHSIQYAGRLTFSHSMSVDFVEDRDMTITRALEDWQQVARTIRTQHGHYKIDGANGYATNAVLYAYDQVGGEPKANYKIFNIWPSDVPDVGFDGSAANLVTVSVTFTYDYFLPAQGGKPATL